MITIILKLELILNLMQHVFYQLLTPVVFGVNEQLLIIFTQFTATKCQITRQACRHSAFHS